MKSFILKPCGITGKRPTKKSPVVSYSDSFYTIIKTNDNVWQLSTPKGAYNMLRHNGINQFNATVETNGHNYKLRAKECTDGTVMFWYW